MRKYWPVFFLLAFLEGLAAFFWLVSIPGDVKNTLAAGLSARRLLMLGGLSLALVLMASLGYYAWHTPDWRDRWLDPGEHPRLYGFLTSLTGLIAITAELVLLYLRYFGTGQLMPLFVRSRPLLGYVWVVGLELIAWLLVLRFWGNLTAFGGRIALWAAAWGGISLLAFLALSPKGQQEISTWLYIQAFDPQRYERHGEDYCAADYQSSLEEKQQLARDVRQRLTSVDRRKALLAIFNKVTKGAKTDTERQLKVLEFIQKASYHISAQPTYSNGDPVYDPLVVLELGDMFCTQGAILAIDLFGAAGYPGRLVQLAHHQIAEIYYDGGWHFLDTDLFGNGETILDAQGNIPSVAKMSRGEYRKMDSLPSDQEFTVQDCSRPESSGMPYPSYYYFSSEAYQTDVPQGYYVGLNGGYEFERAWTTIDISPEDTVLLNEDRIQYTPTKPRFTGLHIDAGTMTLTLAFASTDADHDLAGYRVFVSDHSRGWDYNQFYGDLSVKTSWADPAGWRPEMYVHLFELPPSNLGLIEVPADGRQVDLPVEHGGVYFITVMPFDAYGQSVGRTIYLVSNELRVVVP